MKRSGLPKHITAYWRDGKKYVRARRLGVTYYFKSLPGTEAFAFEYQAWLTGTPHVEAVGASRTKPGSVSALIAKYYRSAEWTNLSAATQSTYRGILERFRADHGDKPVDRLERHNVRHTLFPIVSLALATGTRRGELLGLQWGDVNLDAAKPFLRVERSVEETAAGLRVKAPKTARGRRNIALPADTVAMLRARKVEQMQLRFALGQGNIQPTTLIFGTVDGGLIRPRNLTKAWSRVCAARKLPRVSFHALRHTHVSVLISAGVDVLTISRRIGHSKASMTLDVYGHLIRGGDEAAAKAIEGVLS